MPMTVLVTYASKHGSTEEIAQAIAARLRSHGFEVEAAPIAKVEGIDRAEAVVIGSAVYAGSWMKEAVEFVRHHADRLTRLPVWLFSSGPLGSDVQDEEMQPKQIGEFNETLHPRDHRVFFGALDPEKLGFAERMIVKGVKAPVGDFRNWDDIRSWADEVAADLGS
jgi:menaquinone-dependent protoporphyrinogen oxidase